MNWLDKVGAVLGTAGFIIIIAASIQKDIFWLVFGLYLQWLSKWVLE